MLRRDVFHGIRAIVLDFDGLVLDTETCVYEAWRAVYADHGVELPFERWCAAIGSDDSVFDPLAELRARATAPLDVAALQRRRRRLRDARIRELGSMPGVVERLAEAREGGLAVAVASSSPRAWVAGHLERLELLGAIDFVATSEDVAAVKPAPDLYLCAIEALGVAPDEAVAIEDSPHGVVAALSAGLACVAVPGPMTRHLRFDAAAVRVASLGERPLPELLAAVASHRRAGGKTWRPGS